MTRMSPKVRFLTALLGGRPDRVPVGNVVSIATVELMELSGARFPRAHQDAAEMARLAAAGHELLGYDTIMPVFSVVQESAALECRINWGDPEMMPGVTSHPFAGDAPLRIPDGWSEAPSIRVVLDALTLLRRSYGDRVVIVGKAMGPWSLSYHMMGIEEFLLSTLTDPARALASLEVLAEVTIAFARAQVRAGADIICLADHATGSMVSPRMYREMLLPIHRRIAAAVGCPIVLHCCGDTSDRLDAFAESGFTCYHFESKVRLQAAVATLAGRMTLMGNINNPELLLSGTPEEVAAACRVVLAAGVQILAPECAVPLTTPLANLKVLVKVAEGRRI